MPQVIAEWTEAVYVDRLQEPLDFRTKVGGAAGTCFGTVFPTPVVDDTDLFLIVDARTNDQ